MEKNSLLVTLLEPWIDSQLTWFSVTPKRTLTDKISQCGTWCMVYSRHPISSGYSHSRLSLTWDLGGELQNTNLFMIRCSWSRCYRQENHGSAPHAPRTSPEFSMPSTFLILLRKKQTNVDPTDNAVFVPNVQFSLVLDLIFSRSSYIW